MSHGALRVINQQIAAFSTVVNFVVIVVNIVVFAVALTVLVVVRDKEKRM